jgi:hypothetical protein
MTSRISLALVLHNHQPVGNFGWVIGDVFRQAYEPMVGALEKHPRIRLGLHYTGPLLEWLDAEQPDFLERLRALVERGQVELLGGGWYEPVLAALPAADRHGQLVRMATEIERRFGRRPPGAWLAERVWEPSLAADLAAAGYEYTVLDDNHLRAASVAEDAMWGTYTTDDQGRRLTVFGTEKGLRYLIPFRPVGEMIDYLRAAAAAGEHRLGTMGDDGEKFGAWPGTYEHCWAAGRWIEDCFTAIEKNADWLATVRPSDWLAQEAPVGRIYVPTASYVEMTEWALPAGEANVFHALLEEAVESGAPAARFLRGGMWRNFQARYREINDLHKQMLRVSARVAAMPAGAERERALEHLYRGQSNDCYWHGLFGGIYLPHMRLATHAELIAAEDIALGRRALAGVADYDLDGVDEVALGTVGQSVVVDPAEGGAIGAWDLRATRHALAAVLRRRPEAYHEQLRQMEAARAAGKRAKGKTATSIHDQLLARERGLSAFLVYDDYERRGGLVRLLIDGKPVGDFDRGAWQLERATDSTVLLLRTVDGLSIRKEVVLGGDRLAPTLAVAVELTNEGGAELSGELLVEWNLNLLGGGGNPAAYYRVDDQESRHDAAGASPAGARLSFGNSYAGVDVAVQTDPPVAAEWYPIDTVSNSEAGFERVYQGSCLVFRWPLHLAPGASHTVSIRFTVAQSRDLLAEESVAH